MKSCDVDSFWQVWFVGVLKPFSREQLKELFVLVEAVGDLALEHRMTGTLRLSSLGLDTFLSGIWSMLLSKKKAFAVGQLASVSSMIILGESGGTLGESTDDGVTASNLTSDRDLVGLMTDTWTGDTTSSSRCSLFVASSKVTSSDMEPRFKFSTSIPGSLASSWVFLGEILDDSELG